MQNLSLWHVLSSLALSRGGIHVNVSYTRLAAWPPCDGEEDRTIRNYSTEVHQTEAEEGLAQRTGVRLCSATTNARTCRQLPATKYSTDFDDAASPVTIIYNQPASADALVADILWGVRPKTSGTSTWQRSCITCWSILAIPTAECL